MANVYRRLRAMSPREYCAYNETRANLVAPRVSLIDTRSDPLKAVKVLIEGLVPNADIGLWLNPLKSIPAVPRLSAYDLVYLDHEGCVVHGIELAPDDEVPPMDGLAASALLLPLHSFTASEAQPGDRVVIQLAAETRARTAPVPKLSEAELTAPAALVKLPPLAWPNPIEAGPPVPPPKKRFPLFYAFIHLRIHIHISIAVTPSPLPAGRTLRTERVQTHAPTTSLLSVTPQTSASEVPIAVVRPRTKDASFLGRRWRSLRAAYLHWADSFVFDRPQAQPDYTLPRLGRNLFHFIFPR
jgi:hypothetical protein